MADGDGNGTSGGGDRNTQLVRALQIIRDLDRYGGETVYALAQRYGASTRTIKRDLAAIEQAGLPLVAESQDGERRKRWRLDYRGQRSQLSALLDASHYLALRVAMSQGGAVRPSAPAFDALEDLAAKIETAIGPAGRARLEAIEQCFLSYEKWAYRDAPPDVLWPLVTAIRDRRLCAVTYRAAGADADKTFRVLPLKVFVHRGAMYVMCHVPRYEQVITLHLQRLRALRVLDEQGEPPPDFDPAAWEQAAFGVFTSGEPTTYRLRFDRAVATYIRERLWHPSQKLAELDDGRLELAFRCDASREVTGWITSWGDAVEVLEPESLRRELAALGRRLAARYGGAD